MSIRSLRPFQRIPLRACLFLVVPIVLLMAFAATAGAATFNVTTTADTADGSCTTTTCSLRDAVVAADAAGGANTINLAAGTYTLAIDGASTAATPTDDPASGDLDVDNLSATPADTESLTITGAGAGQTILDANHIDRYFAVHAGQNLSVSGVTFTNGDTDGENGSNNSFDEYYGGAILNDGALSVTNSAFTRNTADDGGGAITAYADATSTSITNSDVSRNAGDDEGGALEILSGSLTLTGDTITDNSADDEGGAVDMEESGNTLGTLTMSGDTLTGNAADGGGGAIYLDTTNGTSITDSTFSANGTDDDEGGAIYDESGNTGPLTVSGSSFSSNSAGDDYGGAIYLDDTALKSVNLSTFSGNDAYVGGAIYVDAYNATDQQSITNSTFSGNHATEYAGAIYDSYGSLSVADSTMTQNTSSYYAGAFYYDSDDALALTNDTIDSNTGVEGGGIYLDTDASTGTIGLLNDTIARNVAYFGGGIYAPDEANSIENTIVADNTGSTQDGGLDGGQDCYYGADDSGATADQGHNLDSDGTCFGGDGVATDKTGVDPLLVSLGNNGGPVLTDALSTGSPAIGAANGSDCPSGDARGVARSSTACDLGAFQTAGDDLGVSGSGPSSATAGAPTIDTFTVSNTGAAAGTGVTLSDHLPAGTTYFGSVSSQGSCSGTTTVTCALGTVGVGATATVTIEFVPSGTGTFANTATVSGQQSDASAANNSATVTSTVAAPITNTVTTTIPGLTITKTVHVKPVVLTSLASEITSAKSTLSAIVNPAGLATTVFFQYGTTARFGKATKSRKLVAGVTARGLVMTITGLKPNTVYHYRVAARNSVGITYGVTKTFRTAKAKKVKKVKKVKKK